MSKFTSRSRVSLTLAIVLVSAVLAGCGSSSNDTKPDAGKKVVRIGFVLPDLSNPLLAEFRDGAVAAAKKRGWQVLSKGTNSAKEQSDAVLSFVAAQVDLIAIDPVDGNAMAPAVKAANAANIPVVAFQAKPASGKLATFISPSETTAGNFMGAGAIAFCKKLAANPCEVGIVQGNPGDSSGQEENTAFEKTVGMDPSIKIVGRGTTDYDPAQALNVATNLLTAHPGMDYMYSWWDQGGAATVAAIKSRGKLGKIGVSSQNGDCKNLQYVINGDQYQDSVFFGSVQGALLITTTADILDGKTMPPIVKAPVLTVTTETANQWLDGSAKPTVDDVELGNTPLADVTANILERLKQAQSGKCAS